MHIQNYETVQHNNSCQFIGSGATSQSNFFDNFYTFLFYVKLSLFFMAIAGHTWKKAIRDTLDLMFSWNSNFQDKLNFLQFLQCQESNEKVSPDKSPAQQFLFCCREKRFRSFPDIQSTPGHLRILFLLAVSTARSYIGRWILFFSLPVASLTQSALRSIWMAVLGDKLR